MNDDEGAAVGFLKPEVEALLRQGARSAAATLYEEFHGSFDDPNYFENAEMVTWGVVQEVFHYTTAWQDAEGIDHAQGHEWHKLMFPDGSTLFVYPRVGCSLALDPNLEPQHQASLIAKAVTPAKVEENPNPDLIAKLASFQPLGPRN
ncbi:MAG: hypothetical protein ACK5YK_00490 [Pseudomonadota bacterium]